MGTQRPERETEGLVGLEVGCPPGTWVASQGGEVEFLYLSVPGVLDLEGPDGALQLWFPAETRRAVQRDPEGATPGARTLDGVAALLESAAVSIESVVLDCTPSGQLLARAELHVSGETQRVEPVASVALALAIRARCPLHATPRLMARGVAAEGAEPQGSRADVAGHKEQFRCSAAWNEIVEAMFAAGLAPERGEAEFRLRPDEEAGTLVAYLAGDEEPCVEWPLASHGPALGHLARCEALDTPHLRQIRNGAVYGVQLAFADGKWRIRLEPVASA